MREIIKKLCINNECLYNKCTVLYDYCIGKIIKLFWLFGVKKKIIFISYYGKGLECNPKYIFNEIIKRNYDYEIYWATSARISDFTENAKVHNVTFRSIMFYYHLATSKLLISNVRMAGIWPKRKQQFYIQTWHAGICLKKVEADVIDHLSPVYVRRAMYDASMTDLMISNSKWESDLYRKVFWYKGEILECGLPREDIFAFPSIDIKNKVFDFYKLNKNQIHLVLYAPTFRVDGNLECYNMDFNRLINVLENKWGGIWKILVRLHPNIQKKQDKIKYDENILNGSQYGDINDLIISSDIFISDYSSCMFDGMLAQKKVVLYASDIEAYEKDRGTLFEFKELPFPLATTNDELIDIIRTFDENAYAEKCKNFKDKIGLFELGNGSRKVVDWIESKLGL